MNREWENLMLDIMKGHCDVCQKQNHCCTTCDDFEVKSEILEEYNELKSKAAKWDMIENKIRNDENAGMKTNVFAIVEIIEHVMKKGAAND